MNFLEHNNEPAINNRQTVSNSKNLQPEQNVEIKPSGVENEVQEHSFSPPARITGKRRRLALEEYKQQFLQVPKIDDRKPVFISRNLRDRLNRIIGQLRDDSRVSLSGFMENLVRHHLEAYGEDIEQWRRM